MSGIARTAAKRARKGRRQPRQRQPNGKTVYGTRLTTDVREKILTAVRAGNYLEVAARYAGIAESTFWDWVRKGRDGHPTYTPFVKELDEAQAQSEVLDLARIGKAAEDPERWTAAAWRLERRYPDRYGRPSTRVQVDAKVGHYAAITPEALRAALDAGSIELDDAAAFAKVWRVLMGQMPAGEVVEGEAQELLPGEAA